MKLCRQNGWRGSPVQTKSPSGQQDGFPWSARTTRTNHIHTKAMEAGKPCNPLHHINALGGPSHLMQRPPPMMSGAKFGCLGYVSTP